MKIIEINVTKREVLGAKAAKAERKNGIIPCVMYGGGETMHFSASQAEFRHLIYSPNTYIVQFNLDGKQLKAVLQEIQFHPVSDKVIHIDFRQVFDDKPLRMNVPVKLSGLAAGVKEGGKLALIKKKVSVKGLIKDLPDVVDVNVENLKIAQSTKVSELSMPNVEFMDPPYAVVATIKITRQAAGTEEAPAPGEAPKTA